MALKLCHSILKCDFWFNIAAVQLTDNFVSNSSILWSVKLIFLF